MATKTDGRRELDATWIKGLLKQSTHEQQYGIVQAIREIMPKSRQYRALHRLNTGVLEPLGIMNDRDLSQVLDSITESVVDSMRFSTTQGPNSLSYRVCVEIECEKLIEEFEQQVPNFHMLQNNRHFYWLNEMTQTNWGVEFLSDWFVQDAAPMFEYEFVLRIGDSDWTTLFEKESWQFAEAIQQAVEEVA